jgi:cell division protein FtsB
MRPLVWIPLVLALGLAFAWRLGDARSGARAWWSLRADRDAAQERIRELRAEIGRLRGEAEALREEQGFGLERAIREDLDLARPGEVVLRVPEPAGGRRTR